MASIALFGLDPDLADQLHEILLRQGHEVRVTNALPAAENVTDNILFAGGDGPDYRDIVRRATADRPEVPVVLVNRHPENARWLDALELGAADYCGAPFEASQVQWVVDSVMREARTGRQPYFAQF